MADSLRVMSSRFGHRYDRLLYASLADRVERVPLPDGFPDDLVGLRSALDGVDVFHLHWPELLLGPDLIEHLRLIELLEDAEVRIVWTQHNLLPHVPDEAWAAIYRCWAEAADGVIHHSRYGMAQALAFRSYRAGAVHRVIRHGHWGALRQPDPDWTRKVLAERYHLDPARIHLGVLGAPRAAKDLDLVVKGFLKSQRTDLDLCIFSYPPDAKLTRHRRIRSRRYRHADAAGYNFRLALLDVLVLPFRDDGSMLTTGLIGDAIATGKPVIASDWPFLVETFGDAAIYYGNDVAGLARVLAELDTDALPMYAERMRALQELHSWERVAEETLTLLRDVTARVVVA